MFRKAKEFSLLAINTGKTVNPASIIPIEKIHAPVLFFSTKADTVWPSAESGEKLVARLRANNFSYEYQHVCFDHISGKNRIVNTQKMNLWIKFFKPPHCTNI